MLEKLRFKNVYILKSDLLKLGRIKIFINFVKEIFTNIDILINYAWIKLNNDNIININLLKISDTIKEILNNEKKLRENVKVSFDNVITDRSSQIDQDELEKVMVQILQDMDAESSTKEYVKEVMEHLDTDRSSHINFEEFSQIIKDILSVMVEENMFLNAISAFLINTNSLRCINISDKEINGFNKKWKKNIPLGRISEEEYIFKLLNY